MPPQKSGFIRPVIYFDHNGTTFPTKRVIDAVSHGMRLGNASTDYAQEAKKILHDFDKSVKSRLNNKNMRVIITSGASEAINTFLHSFAEMHKKPHVVMSSIEHGTAIKCAKHLKDTNQIKLTLVPPRGDGKIHLEDIKKSIKPNQTKLVFAMHINNETGSINDIQAIQKYCRQKKITYFSDCVQSFGKYKLPDLDAASLSFHKMYGPPGLGCLLLDEKLIHQGFPPQIFGSQNHGMRGGTENIPVIAGSIEAMKSTFHRRPQKNTKLKNLKNRILENLRETFQEDQFENYLGHSDHFRGFHRDWRFVQIGGGAPNCLLLSFIKSKSDPHHFCNVKLKKQLLKDNIIVSIGSACNTKAAKASHVLKEMKAPFIVRCGVIRISLGDLNTIQECDKFCSILKKHILEQSPSRK